MRMRAIRRSGPRGATSRDEKRLRRGYYTMRDVESFRQPTPASSPAV
jgi:hypothetical protein